MIHWLHVVPFSVLAITGTIMFFHAAGFAGAREIRTIHRVAAAFFVVIPVLYSLFDPRSVINFLKEAFSWHRDDLAWLKATARFYFGGNVQMPPQGYLNGDQRLWQLVVVVTGGVFAVTGVLQWFFRLKVPQLLYQCALLTHATAFVVAVTMFLVHFYLTTLHPRIRRVVEFHGGRKGLGLLRPGTLRQVVQRQRGNRIGWRDDALGSGLPDA